jgi:tetraprenyl-beta-curcumene synthase
MSVATSRGPAEDSALRVKPAPLAPVTPMRSGPRALASLALGRAFVVTGSTYLLRVVPSLRRELAGWRARAAEIPDPALRRYAARALRKHGNMDGAALFATLAPAAHRRQVVRALVAFQTAYNHVDALSELPSANPVENGERLHQALLVALDPGVPHLDYYAHNPDRGDGGYLTALVDACRHALADLPSYLVVAPSARAATARIVAFQALNLSEPHGGHGALRRWATAATPSGSGLAWWETAAGAGSSLAVHALIAAAADPDVDHLDAEAIERAYFLPIGALHTLLDSLVDRREDRQDSQRSLLDYYHSKTVAVGRLAELAVRATHATEWLPSPHAHRVILTAMCSYYLSAPECDTVEAQAIAHVLDGALGDSLRIARVMFRCRRLLDTLARREPSSCL